MRNVRKFETFEDFLATQEAFSGSGNYVLDVKPGFVYVKERFPDGKYAVYNGTEEVEACDFVDLGLPSGTLWATKNVGAENPEDIGDLFAWGEIETKDTFSLDNYKWYDEGDMTKYNYNDGKTSLDLEDDVAYMANPECGFHMPTPAQWYELVDNCEMEYAQSGPPRVTLTSNINGNSVTFPIANSKDYEGKEMPCEYAIFWTNELGGFDFVANLVYAGCEGDAGPYSVARLVGAPVRGVIDGRGK